MAIGPDDCVLAVNEAALEQLGKGDRSLLLGRDISQIMQLDFDTVEQRARNDASTLWSIRCACHGRRFFALAQPPRRSVVTSGAPATHADNGEANPREHVGSDPRMRHNLDNALKLVAHRVSILMCGVTGTGKEEFAKAVHRGSPWAARPFVAVNCAAIPEALIESELFGYARGAFTDAAREGRHGKLLQASSGTLFLDEIGDIPPPLQTRLLRVLEEQSVTPLGSDPPPIAGPLASRDFDLLRRLQIRLGPVFSGKFRRGFPCQCTVGTLLVIELPPRLDFVPRIGQRQEPMRV